MQKEYILKTNFLATLAITSLITACSQKPQGSGDRFAIENISIKGTQTEDLKDLPPEELSKIKRWQHLDLDQNEYFGVSADKVYAQGPIVKLPTEIIVAVIDSGVDYEHEDLASNMWVNTKEIPNNGIDDDGNGYVDDIHGWNYIGGSDGSNINQENLEETRVFKRLSELQESGETLSANQLKDLERSKGLIESGLERFKPLNDETLSDKALFESSVKVIEEKLGLTITSVLDVQAIESEDPEVIEAQENLLLMFRFYAEGLKTINKRLEALNYYVNIAYDINYDVRSLIVRDDPSDFSDVKYGNNDVKGPDSRHGTHVAGTIAAVRNNNLGMNGIADNVKIMALRAVPNGDERDKDIALAIRYAADNGARIINMSFGKKFSPYKAEVDKAFAYAAKKGVIFFHAAGNDTLDVDGGLNSFPNSYQADGAGVLKVNKVPNWVEVGASTHRNDTRLAARFSNFGQESVTLFSPGAKIYATTPENTYSALSGTSMAAPVASGVAAYILGRYPDLSATKLIEIINKSVSKPNLLSMLSTLSSTGGVINLYNAMELAREEVTNNEK